MYHKVVVPYTEIDFAASDGIRKLRERLAPDYVVNDQDAGALSLTVLGIDGITSQLSSWELLALFRYFDIIGPASTEPCCNNFTVNYQDVDFSTKDSIERFKNDLANKAFDYDEKLPSAIYISSKRELKISEYELLYTQFQWVSPRPSTTVNIYYLDYFEIDFTSDASILALKEKLTKEIEHYSDSNSEYLSVENVPRDGNLNDHEFTVLRRFFKVIIPIPLYGTKGVNEFYANIADFDIFSMKSVAELKERLINELVGYKPEIPNVINIKGIPVPGKQLGNAEYEHIGKIFDGINFEDEV